MLENNERRKMTKEQFYIIALVVGALLYVGMSLIYTYSAFLATKIKYPNIEMKDLNGEMFNSYLSIIQMVYCIPLIGLAIYFFKDDFKENFKDLKTNFSKHITTIILGIFGCLFLTGIVSQIYLLLGIEGNSDNQDIINTVLMGSGWWPMVISVVLIAPFIEEMLFRKLLCGACKYSFRLSGLVTVAVSTILFALIHVADLENLKFIFQYIPLAFVITYSYYHSKNIYVPIAIHFLNNFISVIMVYLALLLGI